MVPLLVAAMSFLAALALAGSFGAAALADRWQGGAAAMLTVQVPRPGEAANDAPSTRRDRAIALLQATPGVATVRPLSEGELADLLRPWLGAGAEELSLPLPAVIEVHLSSDTAADPDAIAARLRQTVPGTATETHAIWATRLSALARSLQACAWIALMIVGAVAAAVIAVATRAGLLARRDAIEIVHGLGATDSYIAARFAARVTGLAAFGGAVGALAALPVLLALAGEAAPFTAHAATDGAVGGGPALPPWLAGIAVLPAGLWLGLPAVPLATAAIGFATAQTTVRRWLRRMP